MNIYGGHLLSLCFTYFGLSPLDTLTSKANRFFLFFLVSSLIFFFIFASLSLVIFTGQTHLLIRIRRSGWGKASRNVVAMALPLLLASNISKMRPSLSQAYELRHAGSSVVLLSLSMCYCIFFVESVELIAHYEIILILHIFPLLHAFKSYACYLNMDGNRFVKERLSIPSSAEKASYSIGMTCIFW